MRIGPIFLAMESRDLDGVSGSAEFQRWEGGRDEVLPAVHIFHTHDDVSFIEEGPVEGDDVRRMALVHDVQLSHNLFPHRRFQVYVDNLHTQLALARAVLASPNSKHTFFAIIVFVGAWITLLTVPPFPAPSSFTTFRSSARRSNLNSRPISSVLSWSPMLSRCRSSGAAGAGFSFLSIRPLTFLRLSDLAWKPESSVIVAVVGVVEGG